MKTMIVIPARLASSRLPEKLLRVVGGKTVLRWTFEAATKCDLGHVTVAVDDPRLAEEVRSFGGSVVTTGVDCASGTDRIAEAVGHLQSVDPSLSHEDVIVNVQGDEPEIAPEAVRRVAKLLIDNPTADMATAATPIWDAKSLSDPGVVKVAMDFQCSSSTDWQAGQGRAVYFSRAVVPFDRDSAVPIESPTPASPPVYWHHLGLYAYRIGFLKWFAASQVSLIERIERLEQLRALAAGKTILVAAVRHAPSGIDTADDLAAFAKRVNQGTKG